MSSNFMRKCDSSVFILGHFNNKCTILVNSYVTTIDINSFAELAPICHREKIKMNPKIKALSDKIRRLQGQLGRMVDKCNHDFQPTTPYDPTDEWFSSYTRCINCGKYGNGWYCHTSPTKHCEYSMDNIYRFGEYCIHCHQPSERK